MGPGPRSGAKGLAPISLLVRVSHLAIVRALPWALMSASACLITSDPTIEEPVPTKPFLEFELATPDPRKILVVDSATDEFALTFEAPVRSEDADRRVQVRVFLDYGTCAFGGNPYEGQPFSDTPVEPGSLNDTGRKASVTATFGAIQLTPGCHRLTLMASHEFDPGTGCPVDPDDFTQITWTVYRCGAGGCGAFDPATCPVVEASCTNFDVCAVPPQ
jgi:hypothetical protein